MASNYGVPVVIDQEGVVLDMTTSKFGGGGGGFQKMDAIDTLKEVFFEIRDGINYMVDIMAEGLELEKERFRREGLAGQAAAVAAGNTDPDPPQPSKDSGDLIGALKDAFKGLGTGGMGLLGIAALIGGMLLFNSLSETFIKALTPVLEFLGDTLIPNIKELNEIIMSHPGGYWTLLGATGLIVTLDEVFGIRGSLNKLFTRISSFARTAFVDDIDFRTKIGKSWAGRINRAIYGTKSGRGGLINNISRFIRGIGQSIRRAFLIDEALALLKTIATSWRTAITASIFGKAARGGKGGGFLATIGRFFRSIGGLIRGVFSAKIVTDSFAAIGRVTKAFGRVMKRVTRFVSKTLGVVSKISGLSAFLRLGLAFAKAIPIVGQIIMVVQGLFGFVTGAIKGFKKEGFLGMIIGALTGLFDGLVASFVNLIFDILGWILKKFGLEKLGQFFMDIDISLGRFFDMFVGFFRSIGKIGKALFKGTMDGNKNIFSSPIKAFKATFAEVMAEPTETSEDNKPVKIDIPQGTDATAAINDIEGKKLDVVVPDIGTVDKSDLMGPVADPFAGVESQVFAPITQTGGDTYNTNASVSMGMSSSHTDETARILSESVYN